eukprot:5867256-Amphidinium_carterae.1
MSRSPFACSRYLPFYFGLQLLALDASELQYDSNQKDHDVSLELACCLQHYHAMIVYKFVISFQPCFLALTKCNMTTLTKRE